MKKIIKLALFFLTLTLTSCLLFEESYKFDTIYDWVRKHNGKIKFIKIFEEDGETNLIILTSDFKYKNTESSGFLFLKEVNDTIFFEEIRDAKKSLVFSFENNIGLPVLSFQYARIDENVFKTEEALKFLEIKNNFSEEHLTKNLKSDSIFYLNNFPESIKRFNRFFIDKVNGTITRRVFLEYYSSNPLYSADFESLQYISNSKIYIGSFVYYHQHNEPCWKLSKNGSFFYEVMRENIKYKSNFFNSNIYKNIKYSLLIILILLVIYYFVHYKFRHFHKLKNIINVSIKPKLNESYFQILFILWSFVNIYFFISGITAYEQENKEAFWVLNMDYKNEYDFSELFVYIGFPWLVYYVYFRYFKKKK
jgi:hypothetical protein